MMPELLAEIAPPSSSLKKRKENEMDNKYCLLTCKYLQLGYKHFICATVGPIEIDGNGLPLRKEGCCLTEPDKKIP